MAWIFSACFEPLPERTDQAKGSSEGRVDTEELPHVGCVDRVEKISYMYESMTAGLTFGDDVQEEGQRAAGSIISHVEGDVQ